ncbi:bifunctional DNA primase/polymerase [Geodermatophilus amargosae]|nr:bifunctional DNA primase/polymerase [Geodermatophilus amargosae]
MFYASAGFPIVANQPGLKRVAWQIHGTDWHDWNLTALTTPEQVAKAWSQNPAYCPGLVTGSISRVLVIDGDVKGGQNPAKELADWSEATGIEIPEGPIARTATYRDGRRGFHRYLYLPDAAPVIDTVTGWLPGVDIICEQRQVLLAPSWNDKRKLNEARGEGLADQQYMWQLPGFRYGFETRDYYPTGEDLRESLEEAVAPAGLLEDILKHGASRTEKERLAALKEGLPTGSTVDIKGLVLDENGHINIEWYEQNGAPDQFQNKVLLKMATKLLGYMGQPDEVAIERCWTYIQKCENTDPTWPWTREDVEYKVKKVKKYIAQDRAKKQAEKQAEMDEAVEALNNFLKGIRS